MHNHLKALYARHGIVESKIHGELNRPRPDSLQVRGLKKMRLHLNDQISRMERRFALTN